MIGRLITLGAAGAAAAYVVVKLAPSISQSAEPVVRRTIKAQIKALQRAREAGAHLMEMAEDAYAEAWADLNEEAEAREAEAPSAGSDPSRAEETKQDVA